MIEAEPFGTLPTGEDVHVYTLRVGEASVSIMDFGATILSVRVPDASGSIADIVLGFGSIDGYLDNPACYGATIGPIANRTDCAEVPLGEALYHLPANDGPEHANNLHSDLDTGLHKRLWEARALDADNALALTCHLADGEIGLPGNRTFTVTYRLSLEDDGSIALEVSHQCDTDAETVVNMTNHSYFNLAGHDSGQVDDQLVRIDANSYLPVREDSVSTGEVLDVTGTPFDFRKMHQLGEFMDQVDEQLRRARGYDHCLCIDGFGRGAAPRHALHAEDPTSGRTLDIAITAPGAHLYTGNWLDDAQARTGRRTRRAAASPSSPSIIPTRCIIPHGTSPSARQTRPIGSTSSTASRPPANHRNTPRYARQNG